MISTNLHDIMKKEKETHTSFAVASQTAKVMAIFSLKKFAVSLKILFRNINFHVVSLKKYKLKVIE